MHERVSQRIGVKAAGGVRNLQRLPRVRELEAMRCGATATSEILDEYRDGKKERQKEVTKSKSRGNAANK
jgi:deoxyribose-phosphate aldolase